MIITQISVSYGETQSLPDYCNVKPGITLTAFVEAGESAEAVEAALWKFAKEAVQTQIDSALEDHGLPARYSTEPRYQIVRTYYDRFEHKKLPEPAKIIAVIPDEINIRRIDQRLRAAFYPHSRKLRLEHAQRTAKELLREDYEEYTLLDCSDGNLQPLTEALAFEEQPEPIPSPDWITIEDPVEKEAAEEDSLF